MGLGLPAGTAGRSHPTPLLTGSELSREAFHPDRILGNSSVTLGVLVAVASVEIPFECPYWVLFTSSPSGLIMATQTVPLTQMLTFPPLLITRHSLTAAEFPDFR